MVFYFCRSKHPCIFRTFDLVVFEPHSVPLCVCVCVCVFDILHLAHNLCVYMLQTSFFVIYEGNKLITVCDFVYKRALPLGVPHFK
jgi:hypothetical protein